jgi:hypothetical protein
MVHDAADTNNNKRNSFVFMLITNYLKGLIHFMSNNNLNDYQSYIRKESKSN